MKVCILPIIVAICLAGCGSVEPESDEMIAKAALSKIAKDPQSIQLRNVRAKEVATGTNGHLICGEWNSRNGFGGMDDWKVFELTSDQASPMAMTVTAGNPNDPDPDHTEEIVRLDCQ